VFITFDILLWRNILGIRKYGTSDDEKVARESAEAREIVSEIMNYGISQKQILYIIHDLALNLEHLDHMRRVVALVKDLSEDDVGNISSPLEVY
jgi:hypothetical protein